MKPETRSTEAFRRPRTRTEVEAALQTSTQKIEADLEALQQEVREMGRSLREALWNHPWIGIGGSLAAGLVVGWILGGLGRRRRPRLSKAHRALVSAYLEALIAEGRRALRRGRDPEQAIRRALEERLPIVVVQENGASEKGVLRSLGGAVLGVVGSALSVALSRMLADVMVEAFTTNQQTEAVEELAPEV